jgi:hypothetical protein
VPPMDFTGRPMQGMVFVDPIGLHDEALQRWIDQAAAFVRGLPPKPRQADRLHRAPFSAHRRRVLSRAARLPR